MNILTKRILLKNQLLKIFINQSKIGISKVGSDFFVELDLPKNTTLAKTNNELIFSFNDSASNVFNLSWFFNFKNLINGLLRSYNIRMFLKGVGYKTNLISNNKLELRVGHSHNICHVLHDSNIKIEVYKQTIINVKSPLKDKLGIEAACIYQYRKPDAYKGKGVNYKGVQLRLKIGKKA